MKNKELRKARNLHIAKRFLLSILYGIFVFILLVNSLLQTTKIQSFIAQKASKYLTDALGVEVYIDNVYISLMMDITLKNVSMKDQHNNDMIVVEYVYLQIESIDLRKMKFSFTNLLLENSGFILRKYENDRTYNISMIFPSDPNDTSAFVFPARIFCRDAILKDCYFRLINEQKTAKNSGFDHNNIDINVDFFRADKIVVTDEEYSFKVKNLQASDKSGLIIKDLKTWMKFLPDGWYMDELNLKTPNSDLDLDLKFAYSTFAVITEFNDSIRIISEIRPSVVDIKDIAFFSSYLEKYPFKVNISGNMDGFVNDFQVNNIELNVAKETNILLDAHLKGIINPETAFMNVQLKKATTTLSDIKSFEDIFGKFDIPKGIIDNVEINADFNGTFDDFKASAIVKATCGTVQSHLKMWNEPDIGDYQYHGSLKVNDLVYSLSDKVNDTYKAKEILLSYEGYGTSLDKAKIEINGDIKNIYLFDYEYDTIFINGEITKEMFKGHINLDDKNIKLDFDGLVQIQDSNFVFDFSTNIKDAYLSRLGFIDRSDDARLSLDIALMVKGDDINNLLGVIELTDVIFVEQDIIYDFNDIRIGTYEQMMGGRKIVLRSNMIDANIEGDFKIDELDRVILYNYASYMPMSQKLFNIDTSDIDKYNLTWDISLKDITPITSLFIPDLQIDDGLYINGILNVDDRNFSIYGQSPKIVYKGIVGEKWSFSNFAENDDITLNTGFEKIVLMPPDDEDSLGVILNNFNIDFLFHKDSIHYRFSWENLNDSLLKTPYYYIVGLCDFSKYPETNIIISEIEAPKYMNSWSIVNDNFIKFDSLGNIIIHNINFYSDSSLLHVNGIIANDSTERTSVKMQCKNIDLSILNFLTDKFNIEIHGLLSGDAAIEYEDDYLFFLSNLNIQNLIVNKNKLGYLTLSTEWEPDKDAVYLDIISSIKHSNEEIIYPLGINGYIHPNNSEDFFDLKMNLNKIGLSILDAFINNFVEKIDGSLSANATLKGNLSDPKFKASLILEDCETQIKYTNVGYYYKGSIDISENSINFNNIFLNDIHGGTATIEGEIKHDLFSNLNFGLVLKAKEFQLLNTNRFHNEIFYGKAIVTGDINVTGKYKDIIVDAKVKTNHGTDISIPISSAMSVDENSYVIFKQAEDDFSNINRYKSSILGLTLSLQMMMTPEGQVKIFLPGELGNLVANGNGLITLGLNKSGDFSLNGTYILDGGRFSLNLQNIISKKFTINSGSKITFNGDPMESIIDASATYGTRTTLNGLGLDLDSTLLQQRINVDCILKMTGELSNPQIKFSLDFPGQSEDFKQTVFSYIDSTNEVFMTQQAFSLLVINSFSFYTTDNSLTNTMTTSGVTMITNQINNWLSQLSNDFNIGINYRPGEKLTTDEIGLALSTQLFNNRVSIDANVGYTNSSSTNRTSSVVGDVTVEVKITKDGRFTTKIFNKSNANDISKIGTSSEHGYTYGVGLNYRKSFDKISDLFTRSPEKRKHKELKKEKRNKDYSVKEDVNK